MNQPKSAPNSTDSAQGLSYRDAGVDIDAGDALVDAIKPFAKKTMRDGVLAPDQAPDSMGGLLSQIDEKRAEELVMSGFKALQGMGIAATDGKTSPDFLPRQIAAKSLGAGFSVSELTRAMNRLMGGGKFVRGVVGQYANRSPKYGLVLQSEVAA